jgi:hypothetical protein
LYIIIRLTKLLKGIKKGRKSGPFKIIIITYKSFKTLKTIFTTTLVLVYFDPFKKIYIKTDIFKFIIASTIS